MSASCEKSSDDDDDDNDGDGTEYYINCKINNVAFVAEEVSGSILTQHADISGQITDPNDYTKYEVIYLYFKDFATKKVATYSPATVADIYYTDKSGATYWWKSGTFAITEYNETENTIKGTFTNIVLETAAHATKTITEGTFFVNLESD